MAPHSSILAWKIPWTEEPGGLQSMGSLELDTTEWLHFHFPLSCIGEGNGDPLQCSCLENPRDRGAWWAAVYGVTQSRTRLKRLSSSSSSSSNYLTEVKLESFDMGLRHQYFVNFPADSNMPPSLRTIALESKEGNGTPLQYSCLENPMDRGAW